jgi:hypothetical protein
MDVGLGVCNVCMYVGLGHERKSAKRWLEGAFDLMRMQRGGMKWPSTS